MATQQQIAERMVDQLRILDPSVSAEVGTPERQIIDAVSQVLAESQVDLNVLNGALDIESKIGSDLDNILSLFGFGRQQGVKSTGYVEFSRNDAAPSAIRIPAGTQLTATPASTMNTDTDVIFYTTSAVTMPAGSTTVIAPVECIAVGENGNVPADSITKFNKSPVSGISAVTNQNPTTGGVDSETDNSLKARFKTTGPFRNLSGTESQYLALAVSTLSQRGNVIGPISKWREYIQIPSVDDSVNGNPEAGQGQSGVYTTALSINRGAKYIYDNMSTFISNDVLNSNKFLREDVDYTFNTTPSSKNKGDAWREANPVSGDPLDVNPLSDAAANRPNVTFTNVWIGTSDRPTSSVAPNDIILLEYHYLSDGSRNDYNRGIMNCVDVYVDNSDIALSTETIARPGVNIPMIQFTDDPNSAFYIENFRRVNEPEHRPVVGNILTPLVEQPVVSLPKQISLSDTTFYKDVHYWLVQDVTDIGGTVRARNGIEWAYNVRGSAGTSDTGGTYTGQFIRKIPLSAESRATNVIATLKTTNSKKDVLIPASSLYDFNYGAGVPEPGMTVSTLSGTNYIPSGTTVSSISGPTGGNYTVVLSQASTIGSSDVSNVQLGFGYPIKYTSQTATDNASYIYLPAPTNDWPSSGVVTINNEDISYSTNDEANGKLGGLTRGVNGTTPVTHNPGSSVALKSTTVDNSVTITDYSYDRNIVVLQATLEAAKQVTTDVLAHRAKTRYFKPDLTVIANPGVSTSSLKQSIKNGLNNYFNTVGFGSTIQLSDIIQAAHNSVGVDSVKWSRDSLEARAANNKYKSDNTSITKITGLTATTSNGSTSATLSGTTGLDTNTTYSIVSSTIPITSLITFTTGSTLSTSITLSNSTGVTGGSNQAALIQSTIKTTDRGIDIQDSSGNPRYRLNETNVYGDPVVGVVLDKTVVGGSANRPPTKYEFYLTGSPESGSFKLQYGNLNAVEFDVLRLAAATTSISPPKGSRILFGDGQPDANVGDGGDYYLDMQNNITYGPKLVAETWIGSPTATPSPSAACAIIKNELNATSPTEIISSVSTSGTKNLPDSLNRFVITYSSATSTEILKKSNVYLIGGTGSFNDDVMLKDNELAALPVGSTLSDGSIDIDSVLTIRVKSESTWNVVE